MSNFEVSEVKELGNSLEKTENKINAFEMKDKEVTLPEHIKTINEEYAGKEYPNTDVKYQKHAFKYNGEKVEGVFPKFDSKFETMLPKDLRTMSDREQFKYCTGELAKKIENVPELSDKFTDRQLEQIRNGEPRISGLTWHHNEIPGKMQLVDAEIHGICRHTGGRSIWGNGSEYR